MKIKEKKKRYFNDYLHTLALDDRNYLYDRYLYSKDIKYNETIERAAIEEIREINDAIAYMTNGQPDRLSKITDGANLNFDDLIDVLEV